MTVCILPFGATGLITAGQSIDAPLPPPVDIPNFSPWTTGGIGGNTLISPGVAWAIGIAEVDVSAWSFNNAETTFTVICLVNGGNFYFVTGQLAPGQSNKYFVFCPFNLEPSSAGLDNINFVLHNVSGAGTVALQITGGNVFLYSFNDAFNFINPAPGPFGLGGTPSLPAPPPIFLARWGVLNWARGMTWGMRQEWTALNSGRGFGFNYVGSTPLVPVRGVSNTFLPVGLAGS